MALKGIGQQIQSVQISQRSEYLKQSPVELRPSFNLAAVPGFKTKFQQLQLLNRIDGVHGALER